MTALDASLEHMPDSFRFALDKTPIMPDFPLLCAYIANNGMPISRGQSSIWSLSPVLSRSGKLISSLTLLRSCSILTDAVKFTSANVVCLASTENSQRSEISWINFAKVWLALCGASFKRPGFVYIDDYSSQGTHEFIQLTAAGGICVILEPSHTR